RARTRGEREGRTRPFSALSLGLDEDEPAVDPDRFASEGRWAGYWSAPPSAELGNELRAVIDALPPAQRTVLELRDVQGLTSAEVCELLELSEANQRVLLH